MQDIRVSRGQSNRDTQRNPRLGIQSTYRLLLCASASLWFTIPSHPALAVHSVSSSDHRLHSSRMPVALITPEAMREKPAPYVDILREAGFEIRYPNDPYFTRGLGTHEQAVEEYRGISAAIAGGEHITERFLAGLPELRVVARAGVGFDRVDVPACTRRGVVVTIT